MKTKKQLILAAAILAFSFSTKAAGPTKKLDSYRGLATHQASGKPPKQLYVYQALIALYFPNADYNSISLTRQCEELGGVLISTANRIQSYSVDAHAGVCKIPVPFDQ